MKTLALMILSMTMASAFAHDIAGYVFGDQKTFEAFVSAKQVTAERLHLKDRNFPRDLANYTRDLAITLSDGQVGELRKLFTDTASYTWNHEPKNGAVTEKLCLPNYGVLLSFRSGADAVRIALCFECDLFAIFVGDGPNAKRVNSEEDLDRIRPQLVALVQALFPNDAQIRSLDPHTARPNHAMQPTAGRRTASFLL